MLNAAFGVPHEENFAKRGDLAIVCHFLVSIIVLCALAKDFDWDHRIRNRVLVFWVMLEPAKRPDDSVP